MLFGFFRAPGRGPRLEGGPTSRHNRNRREVLPFFLLKWFALAFYLLQDLQPLSELMLLLPVGSGGRFIVSLLCMANGMAFAFACVVLTLLLASYLYLSLVKD